MNTVNSISLTDIETTLLPIEQARGLPNSAYNNPAFLAQERDHIVAKTWAGIGFVGDFPAPGYALPIDFMGLPLAMICDQNGDVRVFHNVCSHRGTKVINEAGAITGAIRCPYHSWTYDLAGNLKGTPHIGGVGIHQTDTFVCKDHGLKEVRSQHWFGIMFVNLDGQAPVFEQFIAPLLARWKTYLGNTGYERICVDNAGGSITLEVSCNWKLAAENYCESYHLPWVHPELNTYSRIQDHYHIMFEQCAGQGTVVYNLAETAGTHLPMFPEWPQDRIKEAEYMTLFPNVLLGIQADHVFAIVLEPVANNKTREHLRLMYVGDEALSEDYAPHRAATMAAWKSVFIEDIAVVEGMQKGRESPAFKGGVFSPVQDNPTHYFHQWIAKHILASL